MAEFRNSERLMIKKDGSGNARISGYILCDKLVKRIFTDAIYQIFSNYPTSIETNNFTGKNVVLLAVLILQQQFINFAASNVTGMNSIYGWNFSD